MNLEVKNKWSDSYPIYTPQGNINGYYTKYIYYTITLPKYIYLQLRIDVFNKIVVTGILNDTKGIGVDLDLINKIAKKLKFIQCLGNSLDDYNKKELEVRKLLPDILFI